MAALFYRRPRSNSIEPIDVRAGERQRSIFEPDRSVPKVFFLKSLKRCSDDTERLKCVFFSEP